ncbi:MAG: DUF4143 domain-containing protein [Bacilli bacterium]|nr:DUF4143 domain-containing protein [Bacilli bacterium]MDY4618871.1 DUF4143 domain-containing protein [Bacilli bacterium]
MTLKKEGYKERLIDKKIEECLKIFGAVSIVGPKYCGKTWTSLAHSKSVKYINSNDKKLYTLAQMDVNQILVGEYPILIDEWQLIPSIWDCVRRKCDEDKIKGKFILTGSATEKENTIDHSGAGRICKLDMGTMSLFESGESDGYVSLNDLFKNIEFKGHLTKELSLEDIANLIMRGGWPDNIENTPKESQLIVKSYIKDILDKDINEIDGVKRDRNKMEMLLKSLARNESSLASNETLIKDVIENEYDSINKETVGEYLNVLDKLHLIQNQQAFNPNVRSRENVGKTAKRHFTDPSIVCGLLNLNYDKMISDLNTFGFLFESLVERDLRIYSKYNNGELRHFRNNVSGLEIDSIVINEEGEYGAIEIKLGSNQIEEAKTNLLKFYEKVDKKPKFMCIICGLWNNVMKDPDTGIYIIPINALKP